MLSTFLDFIVSVAGFTREETADEGVVTPPPPTAVWSAGDEADWLRPPFVA